MCIAVRLLNPSILFAFPDREVIHRLPLPERLFPTVEKQLPYTAAEEGANAGSLDSS